MLAWWRLGDLTSRGKKILIRIINHLKCLFRLSLIRRIHLQQWAWLVFLDFWQSIEQSILDFGGYGFGLTVYLLTFEDFYLQLVIRKIITWWEVSLLVAHRGLISVNECEIFLLGLQFIVLFLTATLRCGSFIKQEWALSRLVWETEDLPLLHVLISIDDEEVILLINGDGWLLDLARP